MHSCLFKSFSGIAAVSISNRGCTNIKDVSIYSQKCNESVFISEIGEFIKREYLVC
jgi:hypothetical protein